MENNFVNWLESKLGKNIGKVLGQGLHGAVLDMGYNVIKISEKPFYDLQHIVNKDIEGIAKVYSYGSINVPNRFIKKGTYGRMVKINNVVLNTLVKYDNKLFYLIMEKLHSGNSVAFDLKTIQDAIHDYRSSIGEEPLRDREVLEFLAQNANNIEVLQPIYQHLKSNYSTQLAELMIEWAVSLKNVYKHFNWIDAHIYQFALNSKGQLVAFDFDNSKKDVFRFDKHLVAEVRKHVRTALLENIQKAEKEFFGSKDYWLPEDKKLVVSITGGDYFTYKVAELFDQHLSYMRESGHEINYKYFREKLNDFYKGLKNYNKNLFPIIGLDINTPSEDIYDLSEAVISRDKVIQAMKRLPSVVVRNLKHITQMERRPHKFDFQEPHQIVNTITHHIKHIYEIVDKETAEKIIKKVFNSNDEFYTAEDYSEKLESYLAAETFGANKIGIEQFKEAILDAGAKILEESEDFILAAVKSYDELREITCNVYWCVAHRQSDFETHTQIIPEMYILFQADSRIKNEERILLYTEDDNVDYENFEEIQEYGMPEMSWYDVHNNHAYPFVDIDQKQLDNRIKSFTKDFLKKNGYKETATTHREEMFEIRKLVQKTILKEYSESLMNKIIGKFKKENPALQNAVIRAYVERFKQIKNSPKVTKKDIFQYQWKELEQTVDSNQKKKVKAGKLKPQIKDANLIYSQNGIRMYIGRTKEACIRYGNGYSFCISSRGEDNMYGSYRFGESGTPFFIFNDNLSSEQDEQGNFQNPSHIIVVFAFEHENIDSYYTVTDANNSGDEEHETLDSIVHEYPWVAPLKKLIQHEEPDEKEEKIYNLDVKHQNEIQSLENRLSRFISYERFSIHFISDIPLLIDGTHSLYRFRFDAKIFSQLNTNPSNKSIEDDFETVEQMRFANKGSFEKQKKEFEKLVIDNWGIKIESLVDQYALDKSISYNKIAYSNQEKEILKSFYEEYVQIENDYKSQLNKIKLGLA